MRYDLDQVMTHLKLDCSCLAGILLHPEGHEVEHSLVFEDGRCVEDCLVVERTRILEHFKDDLPGLVGL